jgi:hypothetical protein
LVLGRADLGGRFLADETVVVLARNGNPQHAGPEQS